MKLKYIGPKGHRRINGRQCVPGQVVEVGKDPNTIEFLLSRKLIDGSPEFQKEGDSSPALLGSVEE